MFISILSIVAAAPVVIEPVTTSVLESVPVIVVFCKLVIPLTVKLLSTTALSCILTIPVPLALSSKFALETVVVM